MCIASRIITWKYTVYILENKQTITVNHSHPEKSSASGPCWLSSGLFMRHIMCPTCDFPLTESMFAVEPGYKSCKPCKGQSIANFMSATQRDSGSSCSLLSYCWLFAGTVVFIYRTPSHLSVGDTSNRYSQLSYKSESVICCLTFLFTPAELHELLWQYTRRGHVKSNCI